MRKKHVAYFVLLIIVALLFSGCDAMITNVYKTMNLGQPDPEKIAQKNADVIIEESGITSGDGPSQDYVKKIAKDDQAKKAVIEKLDEVVNSSSATTEEKQASQALIINIELSSIDADIVANNVNSALGDILATEGVKPADVIDKIFPEELSSDETKLADFVDKLAALSGDVDKLAQIIDENDKTAAEGLDIGTIAQTAAIIKFVDIVEPAAGYTTGEAVAKAVMDLKVDPNANVSQYFGEEPDLESLKDDSNLATLFEAAGMDLDTLFGESKGSEGSST
ncbi:MAG: hypothetical protein GX469_03655 [Treponema sp.]|jgi:predicted nucleic acid-binding protein|nr:hypothetical protein [Treponema sp.]